MMILLMKHTLRLTRISDIELIEMDSFLKAFYEIWVVDEMIFAHAKSKSIKIEDYLFEKRKKIFMRAKLESRPFTPLSSSSLISTNHRGIECDSLHCLMNYNRSQEHTFY